MITSLLKAKIACKQHQDCTSQGAAFTAVEQPRLTPKGLTPKGRTQKGCTPKGRTPKGRTLKGTPKIPRRQPPRAALEGCTPPSEAPL